MFEVQSTNESSQVRKLQVRDHWVNEDEINFYISDLEGSGCNIKREDFLKICNYLGVTAEELAAAKSKPRTAHDVIEDLPEGTVFILKGVIYIRTEKSAANALYGIAFSSETWIDFGRSRSEHEVVVTYQPRA